MCECFIKTGIACLAMLSVFGISGCGSQQAYSMGQAWQRNQCGRLPDQADAQRCTERGAPSYDAYRREVEPTRTQ